MSAFFFRTSDVDASTRRFRTDASAPFAPPADGRSSSCAPGTGRRFRTIRSVQGSLRVAEVKKIQADKLAAEIQQKIEAIAASVSQRKAENEAAKTVKRQAGEFSEPKAKRQACDVSKPETGTASPSLPPSSCPTSAPTPIPSSGPSTEPRPATVCQSCCGVRTLFGRLDRCFAVSRRQTPGLLPCRRSALHYASVYGHTETLKELLLRGANPNTLDRPSGKRRGHG